MNRYTPTAEQAERLKAKGWQADSDGWWWRVGTVGYGKTYKEAVREQEKQEREVVKEAQR